MPADVSFQDAVHRSDVAVETTAARRLPLGVGLVVAAAASAGLWFGLAAGVRALFL